MRTLFVFLVFLSAVLLNTAAHAVTTVDFRDNGTFNASRFSEDILTVTSNVGPVGLLNGNGIGVVGGRSNNLIEVGETLNFSFSSRVENIFLDFRPVVSNFTLRYQAFDEGNNLGVFNFNATTARLAVSLSDFFGNAGITSFTMTGVGGVSSGARLGSISYDRFSPDPPTIPLPTTLPILLVGIAGFVVAKLGKPRP